jgi:glycerate kinase
VDPATPGAGAAGGTAFAALAWGAELADGAVEVARQAGLTEAVARADTVVTGEGRYDRQTAGGKAPALVLSLAAEHGVQARLVAGGIAAPVEEWADAVALADLAGTATAAIRHPMRYLEQAGAALARRFPAP